MAEPLPPKGRTAPTFADDDASPRAGGRIDGDDPRVQAAVAGDREAAASLIRELLPRVRNLVRYLCRGDADVDDHAQVALLQVLRALPGFQGRSAFTTWADRVTVRATLRRIKQARARHQRHQDLDSLPPSAAADPVAGPERRTLDRRAVAKLLDALPEAQREALVLHHVVGMSVPEVARELDLPFDTIKSRLRLATGRLRALAEDGAGRIDTTDDAEKGTET